VPAPTPDDDPYCTAANLGVGLITFGDPLDDMGVGSGILAIGGGCSSSATHVINGTIFNAFTHGLVVLNSDIALEGYRTVPNITRILEHEIGHGIGLGHTDEGQDNIMYPSCCAAEMPVPPAIGPDDRAGLAFIYPPCAYTLSTPADPSSALGEQDFVTLTVSIPTCSWTATTDANWLSVVSKRNGTGGATVRYRVAPNLATQIPRSATLRVGDATVTIDQAGDTPLGNGLFAGWAQFFGLNPASGLPQDGPVTIGLTSGASTPDNLVGAAIARLTEFCA